MCMFKYRKIFFSVLVVIFIIEQYYVSIKLAEYGRSVVISPYDTTEYSIVMLDPDGEKINMSGEMWKGSDRITVNNHDSNQIDKYI